MVSTTATVKPWLYWSLFPIHRTFLRLYFSSIEIQGRENLPQQGPCILASKHFSRWDPLVLSLLSQEPLRFMTNANQFTGIQGWAIERLGAFPVNLARPSVSSLRCAIELLQAKHKLVIFPEGGIVRDQPLREFKTGLARLVLQAEASGEIKVPILPIALFYSPTASAGAKASIRINPPLYINDYRQENDKQTARIFTQTLYSKILESLSN
ncbi:1-acyl-sn-glycerol-3-phosphate acyltransferase [Leptolyngbya sp. FACHB-402]|nr:1-acyl-sn-glycerol-3-phosphate acyltransferase [Leptolyngbya sp. FACHB-161]MBD2375230.1 1-acyl-sn-glycerol-3-phosphate acyltransferase [Leptolyngbya sp. FACHB-238]MBD2399649.1 1-acyl-sn-glycerol-3-phosphate acyltransferase [Leptolyngbya sp. FACHB-239]MBD2405854.1 1-acyl-sn-glycerol-3-phosphate acyltransferase [Leptolyngbya sp. FACHB-402]